MNKKLKELFVGYVEAFEEDNVIRVRTSSISGEDATAWIPISNIPASELEYVRVHSAFRLSIFEHGTGRKKKYTNKLYFLRPKDYKSEKALIANEILSIMQKTQQVPDQTTK